MTKTSVDWLKLLHYHKETSKAKQSSLQIIPRSKQIFNIAQDLLPMFYPTFNVKHFFLNLFFDIFWIECKTFETSFVLDDFIVSSIGNNISAKNGMKYYNAVAFFDMKFFVWKQVKILKFCIKTYNKIVTKDKIPAEWMNEWMKEWMKEWMNEWMNECFYFS